MAMARLVRKRVSQAQPKSGCARAEPVGGGDLAPGEWLAVLRRERVIGGEQHGRQCRHHLQYPERDSRPPGPDRGRPRPGRCPVPGRARSACHPAGHGAALPHRHVVGIAALSVAYSPFRKAQNRNHSRATPSTVACLASSTMQIPASTTMASVHRCRRPLNRSSRPLCAVRSDRAPTTGWPGRRRWPRSRSPPRGRRSCCGA
jgi:hypothetical protein